MKKRSLKKFAAIILAMGMVLSLAGCSSKPAETTAPGGETTAAGGETTAANETGGELVIYTAADQAVLDAYVKPFEEQTGIHCEIVSAGTGELMKRIESEAQNPLGDVEFGGTVSVCLPYKDYFEQYTSINEDAQIDSCKTVEGCINCYNILPINMVVNTDLIGDIEINGYEDLLNPELKGKIAFVDPSQSSTGLQQLTAMLAAIGGGDEEKGWEYVEKFIENLDGKMISSSSAVGKGVADGEYVVGLTHEGYISSLIRDGYHVKAVYQEEGLYVSAGTVQIIKGCKNLENAKKFVDFVTSKEAQTAAGETISERGTRGDIPAPAGLEDISSMNIMIEDVYHTLEKTQEYLDRFKDIYTS